MNNQNQTAFDELANEYTKTKIQSGSYQLRNLEIIEQAQSKLNKKQWKEWLRDARINLKQTQAKKLIAVFRFCKDNGQSTDLFHKEGIEKTYIISQIPNEQRQNEYLNYVLENQINTKKLKDAIKISNSENIGLQTSLNRLQEKQPLKVPKESKL